MTSLLTKHIKPLPVLPILSNDSEAGEHFSGLSYSKLLERAQAQVEELEGLRLTLSRLDAKLSDIEDTHEKALEIAVESARSEERHLVEINSKKIVAAGIESLKSGYDAFEVFLKESENLTLLLLDQALAPIFLHPEKVRLTLAAAISKGVTEIGQSSVLNIRLNSDDFGDPSELLKIEPELSQSKLSFEIDPTLQSGESTFELLVGRYEISLSEHWEMLRGLISAAMTVSSSPASSV